MQQNQLVILEQKIGKIFELIDELQAENKRLKQENFSLTESLRKVEEDCLNKKSTPEKNKFTANRFLKKEQEIKNRIEGMLAKLDSLQNIPPI